MTFSELIAKATANVNFSFSDPEVRSALTHLSQEDVDFLRGDVDELIRTTQKIRAIRAVRERYRLGLRNAKLVVDAIADGAPILVDVPARTAEPEMVDLLELLDTYCREAIRKSVRDDKLNVALRSIRTQIEDLWEELIELPAPPHGPTA
jgi:ribosomal protein L7/L12